MKLFCIVLCLVGQLVRGTGPYIKAYKAAAIHQARLENDVFLLVIETNDFFNRMKALTVSDKQFGKRFKKFSTDGIETLKELSERVQDVTVVGHRLWVQSTGAAVELADWLHQLAESVLLLFEEAPKSGPFNIMEEKANIKTKWEKVGERAQENLGRVKAVVGRLSMSAIPQEKLQEMDNLCDTVNDKVRVDRDWIREAIEQMNNDEAQPSFERLPANHQYKTFLVGIDYYEKAMEGLSEEALRRITYEELMTELVGGMTIACESFISILDVLIATPKPGNPHLESKLSDSIKEWKRLKTQVVVLQNQFRRFASTVTRIEETIEIDLPLPVATTPSPSNQNFLSELLNEAPKQSGKQNKKGKSECKKTVTTTTTEPPTTQAVSTTLNSRTQPVTKASMLVSTVNPESECEGEWQQVAKSARKPKVASKVTLRVATKAKTQPVGETESTSTTTTIPELRSTTQRAKQGHAPAKVGLEPVVQTTTDAVKHDDQTEEIIPVVRTTTEEIVPESQSPLKEEALEIVQTTTETVSVAEPPVVNIESSEVESSTVTTAIPTEGTAHDTRSSYRRRHNRFRGNYRAPTYPYVPPVPGAPSLFMTPIIGSLAARMGEISDSLSMLTNQLNHVSQQAVLASPNEEVYWSFANHAAEASMIQNMIETFRSRTHALTLYAQSIPGVVINPPAPNPQGGDY